MEANTRCPDVEEGLPQLDGCGGAVTERLSKNAKKKEKKKVKKAEKKQAAASAPVLKAGAVPISSFSNAAADDGLEIEYVAADADAMVDADDPNYAEWIKIFEKFQKGPEEEEAAKEAEGAGKEDKEEEKKVDKKEEMKDDSDDEDEDAKKEKLSRKKFKLLNRLSISELKQLVRRPDVVEVWDVTSSDPKLLVFLKSYRNSVAVPRHWCNKRKYLQGKRGIEKSGFALPDFIEATGIAKMRAAYEEKENEKSAKQKARAASRPKMSKMDIDYQVLHDAFFRFQTKPKLTHHGELYYEGKEFEVKMKEHHPGVLSDELKTALGMPSEGVPVPPPWLINMQRYGPPPSYPNLKVPGLNAPIPGGAQFGYHPGGWGKPPVDEFGRPIYGDVFGAADASAPNPEEQAQDKKWWGEIEEVEDDDDDDEEEEEGIDEDELQSGISSVTSGLETPSSAGGIQSIELRKHTMAASGTETPDSSVVGGMDLRKDKSLFKVIAQEEAKIDKTDLVGSAFRYNISDSADAAAAAARKDKNHVNIIRNQATAGVEVTLDASELENMDESMLKDKYEDTIAGAKQAREDVSDVFEEQAKKRAKKDKGKGKDGKKYKEYAWG